MNIKKLAAKPAVKFVTIAAINVAAVVVAQIVVSKVADAAIEAN